MNNVTTHNHGTTVTIRVESTGSGPSYITVDREALRDLAAAAAQASHGIFDDDQTI